MFTKRRLTPHVYNSIDKGNQDFLFTSFYTPTSVDEFFFEKVQNPDGSESITLTSDIAMLFNQMRLDKCSQETLLRYFDSLSVSPASPLSQLRSRLSDDQLISIVKSRYIQSPSELMSYSNALLSQYGAELAELSNVSLHPNNVEPHATNVEAPVDN